MYFLPQLPLPSWRFSFPLLWHTPPCIVLRQLPLSPRLDFVYPPPLIDFFCDYIYTRVFSSLPMSIIPSCILYQLTPPHFPPFCLLCLSPAYPPTLLRQLTPPPSPHFIFATFRTPDFSQPPLQFSLLYPRKLVSYVVHLVCC